MTQANPHNRPRILLAFHWYTDAQHEGALRYCLEHGYEAKLLTSDSLPFLSKEPFEGIVGMLAPSGHPVHEFAKNCGKPVVEMTSAYPENTQWGRCPSDAEATGRLAAEYLRRRPVVAFLFVSSGRWPTHDARWKSFHDTLAPDSRSCERYDTNGIGEETTRRLADFLRKCHKPLAVFGSVDESARQVLDACDLAGLRVPEDVFILGFGNRRVISALSRIPLSTVDIDYGAWARAATELLDDIASGREQPGAVRSFAPTGILERASTGGEAGGDPLCERALAIMRETIGDALGVPELAEKLGVSKPTLERAFAQSYGTGVAKRYLAVRMDTAKALLAAGEKAQFVAAATGFASYTAFGKAFERVVGCAPGEYARKNKNVRRD